jgi:hypothetical protein
MMPATFLTFTAQPLATRTLPGQSRVDAHCAEELCSNREQDAKEFHFTAAESVRGGYAYPPFRDIPCPRR